MTSLRGSRRSMTAWRDLAFALIRREIALRYKGSALGVGWALIEPIANVAIYVVVFGLIFQARESVESYSVFAIFGVLPWLFFSASIDQGSETLVNHSNLLRKLAFPRELLVIAVVVSRFSSMMLGLGVAFLVAFVSAMRGTTLIWSHLVYLPLGLFCLVLLTTGISLGTSALQVILRDTSFILRFSLRLFFYACPIVYPVSRVPMRFRHWYELNPLVGILECFHSLATFDGAPSNVSLVSAVVGSVSVAVGGALLFRRLEATVADLV